MQIALLSCYEALLDGLTKAYTNLSKLAPLGWGQTQYNALVQKLQAIRDAEAALFAASAALDDRVFAAKAALQQLAPLLVAVGAGAPQPVNESSFCYSTSLSASSSYGWNFPSGGVWVTANSSYRVPNGCPCGSSSSSSSSSSSAGGSSSSSGGSTLVARQGTGPGPYAESKIGETPQDSDSA